MTFYESVQPVSKLLFLTRENKNEKVGMTSSLVRLQKMSLGSSMNFTSGVFSSKTIVPT